VGSGAYTHSSNELAADIPLGVITNTLTVPPEGDAEGGDVTMIRVFETTVKAVVETSPNTTAVAPRKLVPKMVTVVPPVTGPTGRCREFVDAETPVTVGTPT